MDLREVRLMAKQGESQFVEFKKRVNHPDKIVREVVAFANSQGGTILVGVEDNGEVCGLKYAEEDDYIMQKAIAELCRPKIAYTFGTVKIDEKRAVLFYKIPPSQRKPHYALELVGQRWGKAYIRRNDKSIQASREVLEVIRKNNSGASFGFSYGDEERALMRFLETNNSITLKEYAKYAGIKPGRASQVLVSLALANVIKLIPHEPEDHYVFNGDRK